MTDTEELAMLRAFAERHGWKTRDGAYVAGRDPVFYTTNENRMPESPFKAWTIEFTADQIVPKDRHNYSSTREASEAFAKKEWEAK